MQICVGSVLSQVVLQLEKKLFNYINQDVFRENNGMLVRDSSCLSAS